MQTAIPSTSPRGIPQDGLYTGTVQHKRYRPKVHEFQYGLYMAFLDTKASQQALESMWPLTGFNRPAVASLLRSDHAKSEQPGLSLDEAIRNVIQSQSGWRPTGPIKILTQMRYWGHCFNPVSFYFVYEHADGTAFETSSSKECHVAAVVAEVSNTPWNEMHPYVMHPNTPNMVDKSLPPLLPAAAAAKATSSPRARSRSKTTEKQRPPPADGHLQRQRLVRFDFPKTFHVSPFMPMQQAYNWAFTPPGDRLHITGRTRDADGSMFLATFTAQWSPLSAGNIMWHLASMPLMTVVTVLGILWQAIVVWFMGIPSFEHPQGKLTPGSRWVYALVWPLVALVQLLCPGTRRDDAQRLTEAFTLETTMQHHGQQENGD